jgi:hypothetical protein
MSKRKSWFPGMICPFVSAHATHIGSRMHVFNATCSNLGMGKCAHKKEACRSNLRGEK